METFQYGESARADRAFKRAVTLSLAAHLLVAGGFLVKGLIKPRPVLKRNVYLFEMVTPPQVYRERRPAPPKPQPAKEKPKEKAKAPTTKKERKKAVPEKPKEEPEQPVKEAETSPEKPVSIARPGFPFSYYESQIFNAINRNWRLVPEELLQDEEEKVVVIKFEILKDGSVTGVSIAESSWNSILDGLALRAVEKAQIPPIPGDDQTLTVSCRLVLRRK